MNASPASKARRPPTPSLVANRGPGDAALAVGRDVATPERRADANERPAGPPPPARSPACLKARPKASDRRRTATSPGPPTIRWVIEEVTGAEGREVEAAQAKAIEELVRWWIEEHAQRQSAGP